MSGYNCNMCATQRNQIFSIAILVKYSGSICKVQNQGLIRDITERPSPGHLRPNNRNTTKTLSILLM